MKGHIRERGRGHWYAVLSIRDPDGRRKVKWRKLDATGKRKAEAECARLITELRNGGYCESDRATVGQFLERWLEYMRHQVSPRTHERYAEIARKNLIPGLGVIQLAKLQPGHITAAYAKALTSGRCDGEGGLSPRTVHHMHRILKQALAQAIVWRALAHNPASLVKPPKPDRRPMRTYDMDQTVALMEQLRPTRMFIPALLGILCGLRRGEICALRWDHVQPKSLTIVQAAEQTKAGVRYKQPKSGTGRNVHLAAPVIEALEEWRTGQAEEMLQLGLRPDGQTFVVTTYDGRPLQPRSLTHEWMRLIQTTDLPRIRFHDLRHSHATHLLAASVHPKIASERLGHSKVGITMDLYSHVLPGMQEDAIDRVAEKLVSKMLANGSPGTAPQEK
jgi:integrase